MTDIELIENFLNEMRERHRDEIDRVVLPDGTEEFVRNRVAAGDMQTLLFMLRLGYLMGVHTGFAAAQNGNDLESGISGPGPLQA